MKIYLATQFHPDIRQGETLTKTGSRNRLLAYIYIIKFKDKLKQYVKKGML